MIDIRFHHIAVAFFIAVLCHALAIYTFSMMKNIQEPLTLPRVIQGMLISTPEPVPVQPAEPLPAPEKRPEPKDKPLEKPVEKTLTEPVINEEEAIQSDAPLPESTSTEPVSSTLETTAEPAIPAEPVFTPPKVDAKNKDNPPPAYPRIARRLGQEGTVVLEVFILADGTVGDVKLKTTSGHSRLDDSAIEAVRYWRYTPAKLGDKAISHWYTQSVKFVLN